MASLADLLAYKQKQAEMLNSLPKEPTFGQRLENLSYAAGEGFSDQLRGLQQLVTHPVQSAKDIYAGVKTAVQNPRQALQAASEGIKQATSSPEAATRFIAQNFSPADIANALNKVGTMRELTVYHGTPHKFEPTPDNPLGEFTASKIGTGEGAAAYGHGIYVAENPKVAESYKHAGALDRGFAFDNKTNLTRSEVHDMVNAKYGNKFLDNVTKPSGVADQFMDDMIVRNKIREKGEYPRGYKVDSERAKLYDELRNKITTSGDSSFYTVDLPDEKIDQMLDWDKPLSEQPKNVQQTLAKLDPDTFHPSGSDYAPEELGQMVYNRLANSSLAKNQAEVSSLLKLHGIPGIKYLDEGSRGKSYQIQLSVKGKPYETDPIVFATKEQADKAAKDYAAKGFTADVKNVGTRNFVVFPGEEKNLKILSRE